MRAMFFLGSVSILDVLNLLGLTCWYCCIVLVHSRSACGLCSGFRLVKTQ